MERKVYNHRKDQNLHKEVYSELQRAAGTIKMCWQYLKLVIVEIPLEVSMLVAFRSGLFIMMPLVLSHHSQDC